MNPNSDLQDHEEDPQARLYFARICIPIPLENTGDPGTNLLAGHTGPQIFPKKNRPASFDLRNLWPINCQSATQPKARAWDEPPPKKKKLKEAFTLQAFFSSSSSKAAPRSSPSTPLPVSSSQTSAGPGTRRQSCKFLVAATKLFANRLARISGPSTPTPAPAPTPLTPATDSACSFDALIFDWPPIVLAGIMSTI